MVVQRVQQGGSVIGQDVDGLGHIPTGSGGGDAEPGAHLLQCLVLAQVHQHADGLLEAAQPPPARTQFTPSTEMSQKTYSTTSCGISSVARYGTNRAPTSGH